METKITNVRTISGAAGGLSGEACVNLRVEGTSDTVEQVRQVVAAIPELLAAAKRALAEFSVNGHGNVSEACKDVCAICDAAADLRAAIAKAGGAS